ncbi:MAG: polysaccharide deacetylase family protein [Maricaulaceae bacterium]
MTPGRALWSLVLIGPAACATPVEPEPVLVVRPAPRVAPALVAAEAGETPALLASEYYGDADLAWLIEDANNWTTGPHAAITLGAPVLIPDPETVAFNGRTSDGLQTVPILCYHRFRAGPYRGDRLELAAADFEAQIRYLLEHGYRVVTLKALTDALTQGAPLPRRAVVITIDDGFRSVYEVGFPVLQRYQVPATLYIYSDFIGAPAAVDWDEIAEMAQSGLIDVQAHSKTHGDLTRQIDETEAAHAARLEREFAAPARMIAEKLGADAHGFSYPYGAVDAFAAQRAAEFGYKTAVTVSRGANPPYADPMTLRRDMVFGDHSLDDFAKFLDVVREAAGS